MSLKERIFEDLKKAMKEKDEIKKRTLRMVVAAIKNMQVDKKELTDEDVIEILNKEAKNRKDSFEQYKKADRDDLAQGEKEELAVIESYLPEKLTEDELRKIILEVIKEQNVNSPEGLGGVMKSLMPKIKGRADGKKVSKLAREILSDL